MTEPALRFGLRADQLRFLETAITSVLQRGQRLNAWIFGSRARGDHRPHSDVDILVSADPPLSTEQLDRACTILEESDFPFHVDLVSDNELFEPFREKVERERKEFFKFDQGE